MPKNTQLHEKLRPHQVEAVEFCAKHDFKVLIADGMGTGKTLSVLATLNEYHSKLLPAIVVAPATVTKNWEKEVKSWKLPFTTQVITKVHQPITKTHLTIISWSMLPQFKWWARIVKLIRPKTVIFDEIHYGINDESSRTIAAQKLSDACEFKIGLSGTPIRNLESDMVSVSKLLGVYNPPMIRRLLEDVAPDVPPKKRGYLHIRLDPKTRTLYKNMEDNFHTWVKEDYMPRKALTGAPNEELKNEAMLRVAKLRAILSAAKVRPAAAWIARAVRIGEPVVVFFDHTKYMYRLQKYLDQMNIPYLTIEGATPQEKRKVLVQEFQDGNCMVMLCTSAAKEGITLTRARHILFCQRFWVPADEEQAEDRIHRLGQKYETQVWYLHVPDSFDDRQDGIIRSKRKIVREAIGSPDIEVTSTSAKLMILEEWSQYSDLPEPRAVLDSNAELPEPLPTQKKVSCLIFGKRRWSEVGAKRWARSLGYDYLRVEEFSDRYKIWCRMPQRFNRDTFQSVKIAQDIFAIVGEPIHA